MAALSMAALMVEHLKVLSSPLDGGLISRAPKGDGGQSSLLAHDGGPLQFTYWPLKLSNQWSSLLSHPYQSSPVGPLPFGRAPKGPLLSSPLWSST